MDDRRWVDLSPIVDRPSPAPSVAEASIVHPELYFAESVRMFAQAGMQAERARTLRAWAHYEIERGNRAGGELLWREVRSVFARLGMDGDVRDMDAFLTLSPELEHRPSIDSETA